MLKKFLVLTLITSFFIACKADSSPKKPILVSNMTNILPSPEMPLVCQEVIKFIENYNFKKIKFDDSLSNLVYNNFLKSLDPAHVYFQQQDIDAFDSEKKNFTTDLRRGDLALPFYMFNVYLKRYLENYNFAKLQLSKNLNYGANDVYTYDREKLPWISTTAEMQDLWRKKVKYDELTLLIGDSVQKKSNDTKKAKEILSKRYVNLVNMAKQLNNQDVFQLFMKAVTDAVDPHTSYFNQERARDFNESMSLSLEGIGAQLRQSDDAIEVMKIIPGGPAFKQKKLQVGDKITGVAQGLNGEFEDIIGWRIDRAVQKIKGKKGTLVRLKVIPTGKSMVSKPEIITLTRDKIILEDEGAKKSVKNIKGAGGKAYKIGIIELPSFYFDVREMQAGNADYKSTSADVAKILDTLKNKDHVQAVILDLRGNGGGSLLEVIKLAGLFTGKGPVVQVKDMKGIEVNNAPNSSAIWSGPLGVMIDRLSASASEIFAGAIQDYGRGVIMGSSSFGKGTVQTTIDLNKVLNPSMVDKLVAIIKQNYKVDTKTSVKNNESALGQLNLTIAKFYRINGSSTQHKGVRPDILFPSIFDEKEIGESSENSALPWDTVPTVMFNKNNLQDTIAQLLNFHQKRMQNSVDLKVLNQVIKDNVDKKNENSLPVNLEKLKALQDSLETRSLNYTNEIRVARGLKPLKKGEKEKKDDKYDFILNECVQIMLDFVQLKFQEHKPAILIPAA